MVKKFISLNPVVGCTIACPYCYARKMNESFPQIEEWAKPQFFPKRLEAISKKRKASVYFLTTMSDPSDWHKDWVEKIMNVIRLNPQHTYLFLSKKPEKLLITGENSNIWIGCTVTHKGDVHRIESLRKIPSSRRFISFEPLLASVGTVDLTDIDWVWIGAETGSRAHKVICQKAWVEELTVQCLQQNVPFFLHHSLKGLGLKVESRWHDDFIEETASLF
ncbi:MAG: DUF5131 family protein [Brevinema sp.]